jgi:glutathione S-transferase
MNYTLFYSPGAASLVVHWLLLEIGVPHELKKVDIQAGEQKSAAYLKLNPAGLIPTLLIDGAPMTEAAAITIWLANQHPQAGLQPSTDSAAYRHYLQWMFYLANTLQPAFRQWFYPTDVAGAEHEAVIKENARQRVEACFTHIDKHLAENGPYMCGEQISAADFMAAMLMRWSRNMPKPATTWPAIAAFVARMKARPSFKQLYQIESHTEWA